MLPQVFSLGCKPWHNRGRVARKTPIPEIEKQICRRLLEFRRTTKLTRAALAGVLGLAPTRLANYELGRVPLPFSVAEKLNEKFQINYEWLAEGKGGMASLEAFHRAKGAHLSPIALFSRVYFDEIKADLPPDRASGSVSIVSIGAPMFMATLQRIIARSATNLHPSLLLHYARHLIKESHRFLENAVTQFESEQKKAGLTESSLKSTVPPVTYSLESLRCALKRRLARRGEKAKLAKELRVSHARISEWLGKKEPGGRVTLRLLNWVNEHGEPTINKSPGSASNTARAKTRSKASKHENIRPGRASP